jgi:hypothetical protein
MVEPPVLYAQFVTERGIECHKRGIAGVDGEQTGGHSSMWNTKPDKRNVPYMGKRQNIAALAPYLMNAIFAKT